VDQVILDRRAGQIGCSGAQHRICIVAGPDLNSRHARALQELSRTTAFNIGMQNGSVNTTQKPRKAKRAASPPGLEFTGTAIWSSGNSFSQPILGARYQVTLAF
jgi:hypothetical protein